MTNQPQITTIDEAKAVLDKEIAETQSTVDYYTGRVAAAKHDLEVPERKLWALQSLRRRFDPPVIPPQPLSQAEDVA